MATQQQMQHDPDFESILDMKGEDVVRPGWLWKGTFRMVPREFEFGKSSKKKTNFVAFKFQCLGVVAGADAEALKGVNLAEQHYNHTFYLTDKSLSMFVDDYYEATGGSKKGKTVRQMIGDVIDKPCLIFFDEEHFQKEDGTPASAIRAQRFTKDKKAA